MIVVGMMLQGAAIILLPFLHGFTWWAVAMVLLGLGTALVYPTLLAAIPDVAHPEWRVSAVGRYPPSRGYGYVVVEQLPRGTAALWCARRPSGAQSMRRPLPRCWG